MKPFVLGLVWFGLMAGIGLSNVPASVAAAQAESYCTIGMAKGEQGRTCEVPIPDGCTTANVPGFDQPWAEVSKGGATKCQFDKDKTDWTTTITGSCGPCTTDNCSAQFIVHFDCAGGSEYKPQQRKKY